MAGSGFGRVFGGGFLQNQRIPSSSQPLEAFFISGSSAAFLGSSSMVSFEDVCGGKRSERSSFRLYDQDDNGDEDFDDYFHQPDKKRRLTIEQVRSLEKSFELENKLEPERKVQLAKELGLQPRQVAIWFQNRRARWKTKQLEKDFDALQASYNSLKADYDNVLKEKEKLEAEVIHLTDKLKVKQKEQGDHSDSSNMYNQSKTDQQEPVIDSTSEIEDVHVSIYPSKQEDHLSAAKRDVLECSDSSHYANRGYSAAIEDPGDSSYAFEGDHSDISQDDQDYLRKTLLPSSEVFSKIEGSCNFDLPSEDHDHAPLLWPYWNVNLRM